jgi:hypothetical protein
MGPSSVDNDKLQSVKLLAVEEAGIWIESEEAVEKWPADYKRGVHRRASPSSSPTGKL